MKEITLEELLEAGCHFGHQVTRQNPKSRDFVFEARDNIHIIDLAKTKEELELAAQFVRDLAAKGGNILVVGTKRQARSILEEEIKRVKNEGAGSIYSVTNRWIGGTLTNFLEVAKNYKKLKNLRAKLQNEEEKSKFTKREVSLWEKEKQKLERFYGGIEDIPKIPDALFIIDTHLEELAVKEAMKMSVTTVGIVDTNADPSVIDYPIPANDDAVGSIKLIASYIIDAWIEGKKNVAKVQNSELENAEEKKKLLTGSKEVSEKSIKEVKKTKKHAKTVSKRTKKG